MLQPIFEKAEERLFGKCPDYHDPVTHQNHPASWNIKFENIGVKDFRRTLKSAIKEALEKVLEKPTKTTLQELIKECEL